MHVSSASPFLEPQEFVAAADHFYHAYMSSPERGNCDWTSVELRQHNYQRYLAIRRCVTIGSESPNPCTVDVDEIEDDEDEEELPRPHDQSLSSGVEYHIILSPTYRVPVLYFFLQNHASSTSGGIDIVYQNLVPKHLQGNLREHGIIGGISIINHPLFDFPVFFIHPCKTADAISEIAHGRELRPDEYMLIWLGLVGGCVGLNVPSDMGSSIMNKQQGNSANIESSAR